MKYATLHCCCYLMLCLNDLLICLLLIGKLFEQILMLNRYQMVFKGWLSKQGHNWKTLKKRYFVLHQGSLKYYENESPDSPFGSGLKGEVKVSSYYYLIKLLDINRCINRIADLFCDFNICLLIDKLIEPLLRLSA